MSKTFFGHPRGLATLFFTEMWERFSFYGMRALLTLYMINVIFEKLVERDYATAAVYASYGSLVYASTVIGGKISDQILGMRNSIFLGGILMAVGHFVLAIENDKPESVVKTEGHKISLPNIAMRLEAIFGEQSSLSFSETANQYRVMIELPEYTNKKNITTS